MHSNRRCPSCWSALPAGANRCVACGAEFRVARWRALAWTILLIGAANSDAWWLRGSVGFQSEVESRPAAGGEPREEPARTGVAAPIEKRNPVPLPTPAPDAAGDAAPTLPDARPLQAARFEIVAHDLRDRTLRRASAFVVAPGVCAFPASTLNGAASLMRTGSEAAVHDISYFEADSAALLAQQEVGAPVVVAKLSEFAVGVSLFVLGESERRDAIARCGTVAHVDPSGILALQVDFACAQTVLFDIAGRLVGVAPADATVGTEVRVTPVALQLERLRSTRPTPLDVVNANLFDRDGGARRERATLYAAGGEYGAALAEYLAAIEIEPRLRDDCTRTATACVQLALRTARLDDTVGELVPTLEHAARLLDREPLVLYAYGLALLDEQRAEDAVVALLAAVRVSSNPDRAMNDALRTAYLHASESARREGRPADAVQHAEDALARFPQDALLMKSLGFAYYEIGDTWCARDLLARVVELDPTQERGLSAILAALEPDMAPARSTGSPDAVEIRFDPKLGAIHSRARFNDKTDADVLVDTGATMTALTTAVANDIGLDLRHPSRMVQVETANGKVTAPVVLLGAIDLHGARVTNVEAVVLPDGETGLTRPLIGLNFLEHFSMTLDAQHGVLRLAAKK